MKIDKEEWAHLLELLDAAMALDIPEREGWLNELQGESSQVKQQLREMLAQRSRPGGGERSFLGSPAQSGLSDEDATVAPRSAPIQGFSLGAAALGTRVKSDAQRLDDPHTWTDVFHDKVEVGTLLSDRYVVERVLGEGGMGKVYLVMDEVERERFAIKVLRDDVRGLPGALEALREEVRKTRLLAGPNIVGVYDLNRDRSRVYVKMEYLQGKSLEALLDEDFARGMPLSRAWPIIQGVCAGLAYAHNRGVIHSDLKPSNIYMTTAGIAKVLDFGIARALRGQRASSGEGELVALTPSYACCEMFDCAPPDIRDDVYSLACVIYELLTGMHPFRKRPAINARDEGLRVSPIEGLSRGQNSALARALAFSRERRTVSVEALLEGLEDAGGRRMRRFARLGMATAAMLMVTALAWFAFLEYQQRMEDAAFIESLLHPPTGEPREYDSQTVGELLDQGDDYLREARHHFDPALMSEGVSTAYGAYRAALELDGANRRAAQGVLNVVQLYLAQAKKSAGEGQYKRALELVAIGLRIEPENKRLRQMRDELKPRVPQL
jgi:non-specific serine/threonine protein kinase